MADKIAKQLYVTLKPQFQYTHIKAEDGTSSWERKEEENPLGFAHPYEPETKAFTKKQNTQLNWAYSNHFDFDVEYAAPYPSRPGFSEYVKDRFFNEDGLVCLNVGVRKYIKEPHIGYEDLPDKVVIIPQKYQPRIVDNEPVYGFQIQRSVSRYSTSNKVWRVLDPRGFELEISTANFEDLVMGTTIHEGTIEGKCQWHGKKLVLVG